MNSHVSPYIGLYVIRPIYHMLFPILSSVWEPRIAYRWTMQVMALGKIENWVRLRSDQMRPANKNLGHI